MNLRPATLGDAELLLTWRNDPTTRARFINQEAVPLEHHVNWLTAYLKNPAQHRLYIVENDTPIGFIRFDRNAQAVWELSYAIDPKERGKGYGTQMLELAGRTHFPLLAAIKPDNEASIRAAKRAGFVKSPWLQDGLEVWMFLNHPSRLEVTDEHIARNTCRPNQQQSDS